MQRIARNFLLLFYLWPVVAVADDAELYDPAPPPGSAYVRFLHAAADMPELTPALSGRGFGTLSYPALADYRVVKAGEYEATAGKAAKTVTIAADHYYTIILQDGATITLQQDDLIKNPAKAGVYFYNMSDAPQAKLCAPEHKAAIVDKVAAAQAASREVNALKLVLEVRAGEQTVQRFEQVQLKRRRSVSFALVGNEGNYQALMVENAIAR